MIGEQEGGWLPGACILRFTWRICLKTAGKQKATLKEGKDRWHPLVNNCCHEPPTPHLSCLASWNPGCVLVRPPWHPPAHQTPDTQPPTTTPVPSPQALTPTPRPNRPRLQGLSAHLLPQAMAGWLTACTPQGRPAMATMGTAASAGKLKSPGICPWGEIKAEMIATTTRKKCQQAYEIPIHTRGMTYSALRWPSNASQINRVPGGDPRIFWILTQC